MTDITTVGTALTGIKTAIEIAKALRESDLTLESAEMKYKVAELLEALADAKINIAEFREVLINKEDEIKELRESLEFKASLVLYQEYYWVADDQGNPIEDPYCSRCFEVDHKGVHVHKSPVGRSKSICPNCKAVATWVPPIKEGDVTTVDGKVIDKRYRQL